MWKLKTTLHLTSLIDNMRWMVEESLLLICVVADLIIGWDVESNSIWWKKFKLKAHQSHPFQVHVLQDVCCVHICVITSSNHTSSHFYGSSTQKRWIATMTMAMARNPQQNAVSVKKISVFTNTLCGNIDGNWKILFSRRLWKINLLFIHIPNVLKDFGLGWFQPNNIILITLQYLKVDFETKFCGKFRFIKL